MSRTLQRKYNEKYHWEHPISIRDIRKRNKQSRSFKPRTKGKKIIIPNFKKLYSKKNITNFSVISSCINKERLIIKDLGFVTKKTKNICKLKKLQRVLRAKVLQLSYKEFIKAKDAKGNNCFLLVTGAEKTQAGILRSKIIKFTKEINPIYNKSNSRSLRIYKRNEQRKKRKFKNKSKWMTNLNLN